MASMLEIVTEAKVAAGRSLDRARRAAFRSREAASPDALARVIENDIIPQLLVAHRESGTLIERQGTGVAEVPSDFTDRFAAATLTDEVGPLMAQVEALMKGGVDVETIYIDLLAPAARQLGTWWDQDACDFVDVTMGLWRLQEIVHALSALVPGTAVLAGAERRALFSPAPGEQHGLGALIVEEFFRRAGWQTWSAPSLDEAELVALAAGRSFDLIGLTISVERHVAPLARTIAAVRRASRNPQVLIMVGGRVFTEQPHLAAEIGADGTASDGQRAVQVADDLMSAQTLRSPMPGGAPPSN
jgi:methanogenic corrinoid protein MtbC1